MEDNVLTKTKKTNR